MEINYMTVAEACIKRVDFQIGDVVLVSVITARALVKVTSLITISMEQRPF
jgi:hypothetical protein